MAAAKSLAIRLDLINVREPNAFETAFADVVHRRIRALLILPDAMFWGYRERIVNLATKNRLPAMYWSRDYSELGGLLSYAPSLVDLSRRAATYVDRILKGAKAAERRGVTAARSSSAACRVRRAGGATWGSARCGASRPRAT